MSRCMSSISRSCEFSSSLANRAIVLFTGLVLLVTACSPIKDYTDPQGPYFEGRYAGQPGSFDGELKVVTWNLSFAKCIDRAIETLKKAEPLRDADILMLQEMDETGVDTIARELGFNYVYYPAVIHYRHEKNFGNAILTRWPITDHAKIVLPKDVPLRKQTRIAVLAEILIDGVTVDAINVHLETIWMANRKGETQADYLAEQTSQLMGPNTILAGDFNTWNAWSIKYLEKVFARNGLQRVSAGAGFTFEYAGLKFTLDHIFSAKVLDYEAGVWRQTDASDHYPVWAVLQVNDK